MTPSSPCRSQKLGDAPLRARHDSHVVGRQLVRYGALVVLALGGCGGDDSPSGAADATTDTGATPVLDAGREAAVSRDAELDAPAIEDAARDTGLNGDGEVAPDARTRADARPPEDAGDAAIDPDAGVGPVARCFEDDFVRPPTIGPDYDQFGVVPGGHCLGTNHQDITGIERVVFVGDSVTVGTPPTLSPDFYRARLANALADRFGLARPDLLWQSANPIGGMSFTRVSGDFASCARWGARADDLLRDGSQLADCMPEADRDLRTLVVMTIGGNDISSITQAGIDGTPVPDIWVQTEEFVGLMRDAIRWIVEPGRFPNGVFVLFSNMFEFTDGTGDVAACPAAGLAGFGAAWDDPMALADMVIWANEQFASIAVETQTDMIFMLEHFCGHGWNRTNPESPCFRGADSPLWFDLTCIHPNPDGHGQISDMFDAVVAE